MSASPTVPDLITHYYLPGRQPFLNLSDLEDVRADEVMADLMKLRADERQHRPFGRQYLSLRRLTECRLREMFVASGGSPERNVPHYFVLGESEWFEHLASGMRSVQVRLADLPPDKTSVTYPDSFVAMEIGPSVGITHEPRPYHGKVFTLDDLPTLIEQHGIPSPVWGPEHRDWNTWPQETFIEVQVWSDTPVAKFLDSKAVLPKTKGVG